MPRQSQARFNYRGIPILPTKTGRWQALITIGRKRDGTYDRRHREGKTVAEVKAKIRQLLAEVDAGRKPTVGRAVTVEAWLTTYLDTIAPYGQRACGPNTLRMYRGLLKHWITPAIGGLPLDLVEPEDLDQLYARMRAAKKAEATILRTHYLMRKSLRVAMRRGKLGRNVADLVEPPASGDPDRAPLPADVTRRVLQLASQREDGSRWWFGLATGARQGETLGLAWEWLDLDQGLWRVEWQLQRRLWAHGCEDPHACARQHCRTGTCPPRWDHGCDDPAGCRIQAWRCPQRRPRPGPCPTHRRACPPACPPDCTGHAKACPARVGGGLRLVRPKTWRPGRPVPVVAIPDPVVALLRQQQARQEALIAAAGSAWRKIRTPDGAPVQLVWTAVDGAPVDPRRDWQAWQDLLIEAGAPRARVHKMRHTAASTLLALGVDLAVVQEVLRHTDIRQTRAYTAVAETLTRGAADRMGRWLAGADVTGVVTGDLDRSPGNGL